MPPGLPANTDRTLTFNLSEGVQLYGGFTGNETQRDQRDWETNVTVLSGDYQGNDITDANGVVTDPANIIGSNRYHVVTADGTSDPIASDTVLDGFTITAGQANGSADDAYGGGFYCNGSGSGSTCNPTLRNLIFAGNFATNRGGALYNDGYQGESSPSLSQVAFYANEASYSGGAMYNNGYQGISSPSLSNVLFSGNAAATYQDGGAMYNNGDNGESSPSLVNVTFYANAANRNGGAMFTTSNSGTSNPSLENVVLWENTAGTNGDQLYSYAAALTINYTLIQSDTGDIYNGGGATISYGSNTLSTSPLFVDADGADDIAGTLDDDLRLGLGSPAIDAGDNAICPSTDIRGENRDDWTCDMGAYEVQLSDSDTVSKTVSGGNSYTFGSTLAEVVVDDNDGCLTGLTIQRVESNHPQATSSLQTGRYWAFTPTGCASGFSLTLTLPFTFTTSGDENLCHYDGSNWDCGQDADNTTASTGPAAMPDIVTRQNVTQLSDWAVGDGSPTAVTLAAFGATPQGQAIVLTWETATETDLMGFHLYRAEAVGGPQVRLNEELIPGQAPGSPGGAVYTWRDEGTVAGTTYYYWLESVDTHGQGTRHGPVWTTTGAGQEHRVYLPLVLHSSQE